ncbi:MAG TPA: hypothetical protein VLC09_00910 [Polyangiaceae bacterium]|nr:hypothetical protein [Polyangiaceae bacterium]
MVRISLGRAMGGRVLSAALLVAACSLSVTPAWAVTPEEKAAAEAQFDEGLKLLKAGNYETAAKKFESSQRVEPGIGTLLYLGECYEKMGRTASAWATFREAASMAQAAGQADRARIGTQRADRLTDKLSKWTIEPAPSQSSLDGLEVSSDGKPISKSLWGTAVPVDPGEHVLTVSAPGHRSAELRVSVGAGAPPQTVQLPVLEVLPPEATPAAAGGGAVVASTQGPPADEVSDGSGQRTAGLVTAGVGVVALGVGAAFGFIAIDNNNQAIKQGCSTISCPANAQGVDEANAARDAATVSTIGFIAGGVLVAAGAVFYFTAPDAPTTARLHVTPTLGGAALSFGGTFQ